MQLGRNINIADRADVYMLLDWQGFGAGETAQARDRAFDRYRM